MAEQRLDRIHIRDLTLRCVIGTFPEERRVTQDISLNITLHADLRRACQSDNLEDTIDYKALKLEIVSAVEDSSFHLIERLAERIAEICLTRDRIQRVRVTLEKPGALRFARTVAVEIERSRDNKPTSE